MRKVTTLLTAFACAYLFFGGLLYFSQEKIVYVPDNRSIETCEALPGSQLITHEDTRMYIKDNGSKVMVLYHGNAGNACDRSYITKTFESMGYSYILVEYRGYGGDGKNPSHAGVKRNVKDVTDYLETKKYSEVLVVGESIGSGPALLHTSIMAPSSLILINPFRNLPALAKSVIWYYPFSFLIKNDFKNDSLIAEFKGNLLIVSSAKDEIIPPSHGERLFALSPSQNKQYVPVKNATHNTVYQSVEAIKAIQDFAF